MAGTFLILIFLTALVYMQKILAHYDFIRKNDPSIKNTDFGEFFYKIDFSFSRFRILIKLGSLAKVPYYEPDNVTKKDVERINLLIVLTIGMFILSVIVLLIGVLTGGIR